MYKIFKSCHTELFVILTFFLVGIGGCGNFPNIAPTLTFTPTITLTPTITPSPTVTLTPTLTPTLTLTPTFTPTPQWPIQTQTPVPGFSSLFPIKSENIAFISLLGSVTDQQILYFDISPSGQFLATWKRKDDKGSIDLWDISQMRIVDNIESSNLFVFFSDEELVIPQDNNLMVWNFRKKSTTIREICKPGEFVNVQRNNPTVLLCINTQKKSIKFIETTTMQTIGSADESPYSQSRSPLAGVFFNQYTAQSISPNNAFWGAIFETRDMNTYRLILIRELNKGWNRWISPDDLPFTFAFSYDSKQISVGGYAPVGYPEILVYNLSVDKSGLYISRPEIVRYENGEASDATSFIGIGSYSPVENLVFVCDYSLLPGALILDLDKAVHVIDTTNKRKLYSIPLQDQCQNLAISRDGRILGVRTNQGLELWAIKPEGQRIISLATQIAPTDSLKRIYGPASGKIDSTRWQQSSNWISANINKKNYIIRVNLVNSVSKGDKWPWPFHLAFRQSRTEDYACLLHFSITGAWRFDVDANGDWRTIDQGEIPGYQSGKPFQVKLVVQDDYALLYINEEFVDVLRVADNPKSGDVVLALPLGVEYQDFTVFEIPESSQ